MDITKLDEVREHVQSLLYKCHYVNIQERGVIDKDLAYLDGKELDDYLNDIAIAQKYSTISRQTMLYRIADAMGWEIIDEFESMHNYIDLENGIIRKGATSAQAGVGTSLPHMVLDVYSHAAKPKQSQSRVVDG